MRASHRHLVTVVVLAMTLLGAVGCGGGAQGANAPAAKEEPPRFRVRNADGDGFSVNYAIYVPPEYDSRPSWPLIVFVHDWGERGTDGITPTKVGIGPAVLDAPERYPALVLVAQIPRTVPGEQAMQRHYRVVQSAADTTEINERELDIATAGIAKDGYPRELIDAAFDDVVRHFHVDEDRVYLTGISTGGIGAWAYAAANPTRFAALSILGGGGDGRLSTYLPHLPIRFYHGKRDDVIPPFNAERLARRLRHAGGVVDITIYPDLGHNVWDRVYSDDEAIAWLFDSRL